MIEAMPSAAPNKIAVLAEVPLPGRCLPDLLAAHAPEWVAGLYAAMLRDTLDGLLSIDASEYVVYAADDEAAIALAAHVPAPWRIVAGVVDASAAFASLGATDGSAILARSDAPSAPIMPILEALAASSAARSVMLGPSEDGRAWLVGARGHDTLVADLPWGSPELVATMRVRCTKASVTLRELPIATIVDQPSAVLALLEELRRHPERAPRTAQFVVTHA